MKLKRSIVAGSLLATALVGMVLAGVLVRGNNNGSLGEQVAQAVGNSESYFESEVSSYRYRTTFSETRNDLRYLRDLRSDASVEVEI